MDKLFQSGSEMLVKNRYLYLPLMYDKEIDTEVSSQNQSKLTKLISTVLPFCKASSKNANLIKEDQRYFIKAISLKSLAESFATVHKEQYEEYKKHFLGKQVDSVLSQHIRQAQDFASLDPRLETIVFKIMPYFIQKSKGLQRRKLSEKEIVEIIHNKADIPASYTQKADEYLNIDKIQNILSLIEKSDTAVHDIKEGIISAKELSCWFYKEQDRRI